MIACRIPGRTAIALAASCGLMMAPALAQSAPDREFGRYLSSECVACHQLSGRSAGIPPIVGLPSDAFVAAMSEYRAKKRENVIMQSIAGKFRDEEIAALAAYFGGLAPAD